MLKRVNPTVATKPNHFKPTLTNVGPPSQGDNAQIETMKLNTGLTFVHNLVLRNPLLFLLLFIRDFLTRFLDLPVLKRP